MEDEEVRSEFERRNGQECGSFTPLRRARERDICDMRMNED
jgi:hypothetical protein